MVAVTVEFLTGRFVATSAEERQRHEWPPHPARLFSALVAAWADLEDAGELDRAAIEWLERQPAPLIAASEATERSVLTHFVPVNDAKALGNPETIYRKIVDARRIIATTEGARCAEACRALEKAHKDLKENQELLPSGRERMPRCYPSVTPAVPRVSYMWPHSEPSDDIAEALDRILATVTRLGHSSSLVSGRIDHQVDADALQVPVWAPDPEGKIRLRTTTEGLLRELEDGFKQHQGCRPRTMPSGVQRYRLLDSTQSLGAPQVPDNAGEWFVFTQVSGRRLPVHAAANLTSAVRAALMRSPDRVPELISGHGADGTSSNHPHLTVLALPFVGREHADGHLLGFAILLPNSSPLLSARDEVLRAIGRWEGSDPSSRFQVRTLLRGGEELRFKRIHDPLETWSLRRSRWDGPARTWVSVTPIALDRHPGNLASSNPETAVRAAHEAEESIRTACAHVGIEAPSYVAVTRSALVVGSRPARSFPAFRGGGPGSPQRLLVHARVVFDADVRGPLLLGAGRYLGIGLMAPEG